jgi:hypothetical protein
VACFADLVYPIQALSHYYRATGDGVAWSAARQCAALACERQGAAGQWWWHYDVRRGAVIEGYPVYAVHQDAMAPMALFAVADAGGPDYSAATRRGLEWLEHAPELHGPSLIDAAAGLVWRKVARREPGKLTRTMQAAASAMHPALRAPGTDTLFPPVAIDWECRPYHLAWILYADDSSEYYVNNHGVPETLARRQTWANNVEAINKTAKIEMYRFIVDLP